MFPEKRKDRLKKEKGKQRPYKTFRDGIGTG